MTEKAVLGGGSVLRLKSPKAEADHELLMYNVLYYI